MKSILRTLVSLILCASLAAAPTAPVVVNPNTSVLISPTAAALLAANPTLGGMISITGTANEITVAGTTTPTLSLPAALTFTAKTITGGTFASPTFTTPALGTPSSGDFSTGAFTWPTFDQNTTGSAATLTTTRTIGGSNFNGSADVTSFPAPGAIGGTTPSTIAGTTGTFSGELSTTGAAAYLATYGAAAHIYTDGANAQIYTSGTNASISTGGSNAHISTGSSGAYIQTRSTFRLNGGTFVTTLSHAATANRAIAFPDAAGTLALVSGDLGTPSAIVLTNASGTLPAGVTIPLGTVTLTGTLPDARNTVSNSTTTTMSALGTIGGLTTVTGTGAMSLTGGAGDMTITSGTGNSRTLALRTTTAGGVATTALSLGANQVATFTNSNTESAITLGGTSATDARIKRYYQNNGDIVINKGDASGTSGVRALHFSVASAANGDDGAVAGMGVNAFGGTQGAYLGNTSYIAYSTTVNCYDTSDLRLYRYGSGVLSVDTTAAGNALGSLRLSNITASGTLAVTGSSTLTGNLTSNGALISTPEALAPALNAGAAVGVTTLTSTIAVNGTNAVTLANGTGNGQIKTIICTAVTAAGTATVTPTTANGFTSIAFTAAGQSVTLQYFSTGGWVILSVRNATIAALGDAQRHRCTGEALALCV